MIPIARTPSEELLEVDESLTWHSLTLRRLREQHADRMAAAALRKIDRLLDHRLDLTRSA